jgi:hypothetical protein
MESSINHHGRGMESCTAIHHHNVIGGAYFRPSRPIFLKQGDWKDGTSALSGTWRRRRWDILVLFSSTTLFFLKD